MYCKKINELRVTRFDTDRIQVEHWRNEAVKEDVTIDLSEAADLHYMLSQILTHNKAER